MILKRIEASVGGGGEHSPFVVQDSDLGIFDSDDTFDFCVPPQDNHHQDQSFTAGKPPTIPGYQHNIHGGVQQQQDDDASSCCEDFSITSRRIQRRRSSICSISSTGSSICSKSMNWGDTDDEESLASMEFSMRSRSSVSNSRRSRRSIDFDEDDSIRHRHTNNKKKTKKVTFHRRLKVRGIPHMKDMSKKELHVRWYQEEEIAVIKSQSTELIRRAKANEGLPEGESLRGLHMSKKQQRKSLWVMALSCVLDEQKRQSKLGIKDPETIATLYKSFSTVSEQMSIANGKNDSQQAAAAYLS